jgi:prophage regulatory protein
MTIRFLRLPAVLDCRARKRSTHYRDIADGLFPPPIHLGLRCSAWPEHEVDAILRAQIAGASSDELRGLVVRLVAERARLAPSDRAAP